MWGACLPGAAGGDAWAGHPRGPRHFFRFFKFFTPAIADSQGTDGTDLPRLAKDHHRYPTLAIIQFVQIRAESPKSLRHQCEEGSSGGMLSSDGFRLPVKTG